jgi:hypothetical protein
MALSKVQLIALQTRLNAITGFHQRSLLESEWKGVSSVDFTPSGSLTYLTNQEFADAILAGHLIFSPKPRVAATVGVPPSAPTS